MKKSGELEPPPIFSIKLHFVTNRLLKRTSLIKQNIPNV